MTRTHSMANAAISSLAPSLRVGSCAGKPLHQVASRCSVVLLVISSLLSSVPLGCAGAQKKRIASNQDSDAVRYRLPLRNNPVDPGGAFRCYGGCQESPTPGGYAACLSECPGFTATPGFRCADYEVPPIAACFTARKLPFKSEMDPALVVLGVIAGVAVVVSLSSVCASTPQSCNGRGGLIGWY